MSKFDPIGEDVCSRLRAAEDMETVRVVLAVGRARLVRAGMESDELAKVDKVFEDTIASMDKKLRVDARRREAKIVQTKLHKMREEVRARWNAQEKILIKLRATRDAKKAKLAALIKDNQRLHDEIKDMKELHVLNQERIRFETSALESRKEDLEQTMAKALEIVADFDQKMANAPWRKEMERQEAERRELNKEIAQLEADIKAFDDAEERERIAAESEEKLPLKDFCVQFAKLQVKKEEMERMLAVDSATLNELKEADKKRRLLEDTFDSDMDCTLENLCDYDDDLDRDTQRTEKSQVDPMAAPPQMHTVPRQLAVSHELPESTQEQLIKSKKVTMNSYIEQKAASISAICQSPPSSISSASNENSSHDSMRDKDHKMNILSIPHHNPDESIDEAFIHHHTGSTEEAVQHDKPMELNDANENSQSDEMEEDGENEEVINNEDEDEVEVQFDIDCGNADEGEGGDMLGFNQKEKTSKINNVFNLFDDVPMAAVTVGERQSEMEHNTSVNSQDGGLDVFAMMDGDTQLKQSVAGSPGASPSGSGIDFFNLLDAGGEGSTNSSNVDFSFNFVNGGDEQDGDNDEKFIFFNL